MRFESCLCRCAIRTVWPSSFTRAQVQQLNFVEVLQGSMKAENGKWQRWYHIYMSTLVQHKQPRGGFCFVSVLSHRGRSQGTAGPGLGATARCRRQDKRLNWCGRINAAQLRAGINGLVTPPPKVARGSVRSPTHAHITLSPAARGQAHPSGPALGVRARWALSLLTTLTF